MFGGDSHYPRDFIATSAEVTQDALSSGLGSTIICPDFNELYELEDFNQIGDEKGIGICTFQCRLLGGSPCHESLERFHFFDKGLYMLYSHTTVCV